MSLSSFGFLWLVFLHPITSGYAWIQTELNDRATLNDDAADVEIRAVQSQPVSNVALNFNNRCPIQNRFYANANKHNCAIGCKVHPN